MKIAILDVQHTIFEGVVSEAVLPGADGELTVLDDHESLFVVLTKGHIRLDTLLKKRAFRFGPLPGGPSGDEIKSIKIQRGLARMKNNELVILVE
jgi:hypothetical protein